MASLSVVLVAIGAAVALAAPAHAQAPVTRRPGTVRHFFTASEEEFCAKAREWGYTEDC